MQLAPSPRATACIGSSSRHARPSITAAPLLRQRSRGIAVIARAAAKTAASAPPPPSPTSPKQPPSPPAVPLLHHLPLMGAHFIQGGSLESLLEAWTARYGRYVEWRVPGSPRVLTVTDPDALREACEVFQLAKSPRYTDLLPLLGRSSMVLTEGAEWRAQRDAFNPGFASSFLRGALPRFVACTRHLLEALDAAAAATAAEEEAAAAAKQQQQNGGSSDNSVASSSINGGSAGVVRVHHLAILLTLEVILSVGFGDETRFLHADTARPMHPLLASFVRLGRHLAGVLDNPAISWVRHLPFFKAKTATLQAEYEGLLMEVLERRLKALGVDVAATSGSGSGSSSIDSAAAAAAAGGVCPMRGLVGGEQQQQQQQDVSASVSSTSSSSGSSSEAYDPTAAGSRAESPTNGGSGAGGRTILELALEWSAAAAAAQQKGGSGGGSENGAAAAAAGGVAAGLDVPALRDQLATFFAAGHDTTASLVAWAVYYLCRHPEAEARLVSEIDAALADGGGDATAGDAAGDGPTWKQLADMPYLTCVLKETLRLRPPVGIIARWAPEGTVLRGYDAGGKVVLMSPYLQHTDAEWWGAGAKEWRPERWEGAAADALPAHPYAYMPFSRGPRDCIGARFAMLEAKTILAMVYQRYSLRYAAAGEEGVLPGVTAHPSRGVPVRVAWRRRTPQRRQGAYDGGGGAVGAPQAREEAAAAV